MENDYKYIARFQVETLTPLGIGTGRNGLLNERLIARDANGLPYIPGTSLAGVVRHELIRENVIDEQSLNELFGYQSLNTKDGQGSRISFSSGFLLGIDGKTVIEGLKDVDFSEPYYAGFRSRKLPQRDHVRINHRGVAEKTGKFEEELVYKGTRFVFELELSGTIDDVENWERILSIMNYPSFRIGGGTRKGFGHMKIVSCFIKEFNLSRKEDLLGYLGKSSSLNSKIQDWKSQQIASHPSNNWIHYKIELQPESYFLFGAGLSDENVDMKPKRETIIDWSSGKPELIEEQVLIPATAIKGAIAHRMAFHYNLLVGNNLSNASASIEKLLPNFDIENTVNSYFENLLKDGAPTDPDDEAWGQLEQKIDAIQLADILVTNEWKSFKLDLPNIEKAEGERLPLNIGEENHAVKTLFGYAKSEGKNQLGARGKVILSDIYLPDSKIEEKVFSHVMIDRFTGGALDGALYQESVIKSGAFELDIFIEPDAFDDLLKKEAFENTLKDLISGNLPLGGNSTKGHGIFYGSIK